jgi:two-component system sensor histidine kinase QseC
LRTPLAGLKTQVQVALAAADARVRENALRQSLVAVDRTTRLVRQLLALAKVDASVDVAATEDACVGEVIEEIVDALAPLAAERRGEVDPTLHGLTLRANRELLGLALRNLHENAVLHSPPGGRIAWGVLGGVTGVYVEDEGPGIPAAELELVTRRFFRGRHKSESGSGLGLAIVDLALRRSGGELRLINKKPHGLRAEVVMVEPAAAASLRQREAPTKMPSEQITVGLS